MYDDFSLASLLQDCGFIDPATYKASESSIKGFVNLFKSIDIETVPINTTRLHPISLNTINTNVEVIQNTIQNITYDASNNITNTQDINTGSIYQPDGFKINQASGSSTSYNYLQKTNITDLNVTGTLSIPSGTTINGATYNSDIVLTNPARIMQSGYGVNNLNETNFTGNVTVTYGLLQNLPLMTYTFLSTISSTIGFTCLGTKRSRPPGLSAYVSGASRSAICRFFVNAST
jgi:hypothetical protein